MRNDRASGQSYVVFGKSTGFLPALDLSALDGRNGFILKSNAPANESATLRTTAKGAGDVNGDGIDDLIVSENVLRSTDASVVGKSCLPLELLVLSACETARGDNRAVLGLAGLAAKTGTRSVLSTLWDAQDIPNTEFMARFYQVLSKPGTTKAERYVRHSLP